MNDMTAVRDRPADILSLDAADTAIVIYGLFTEILERGDLGALRSSDYVAALADIDLKAGRKGLRDLALKLAEPVESVWAALDLRGQASLDWETGFVRGVVEALDWSDLDDRGFPCVSTSLMTKATQAALVSGASAQSAVRSAP